MQIKFIFSLDKGEFRIMYLKNNDAKIMMGIETDDIINEPFESSLKKYQEGLETKMKRSHFIFESANLLYYYLHKISIK